MRMTRNLFLCGPAKPSGSGGVEGAGAGVNIDGVNAPWCRVWRDVYSTLGCIDAFRRRWGLVGRRLPDWDVSRDSKGKRSIRGVGWWGREREKREKTANLERRRQVYSVFWLLRVGTQGNKSVDQNMRT